MTHAMTVLVFQLASLLLLATALGHIFQKRLRLPRVLGELVAGMVAGPFLLGRLPLPGLHQTLFPMASGGTLPVTPELYGFAVVASVVLLFLAGLETDLPTFLRFAGIGGTVGIVGVAVSFFFGAAAARLFLPGVTTIMDPAALFLGTLSTATSVGVTARILSERRKMSTPEGVTILAAAVLDDVIGIVLLAVVVALARVQSAGVDWSSVALVAGRAFGFWIAATAVGIIVAPHLVRGLKRSGSLEVVAGTAFGLALLLSGVAETAGLAMIIGAYVVGLSLSPTDVADQVRERLHGLHAFLVPLFFAVMGLMVDFAALRSSLVFGLVFSLVAIAGKLVGCGVPAVALGFSWRGALRIGAGMLPRGEVTLIVAGIGLSTGVIGPELFGVAVMTLLVSSVMAPPVLIASFNGGPGYRRGDPGGAQAAPRQVQLTLPTRSVADFVRQRILAAFRGEGFFVSRLDMNSRLYRIRQEEVNITLDQRDTVVTLSSSERNEQLVRLILLEELVELRDLMEGLQDMKSREEGGTGPVGDDLVGGLFD